MAVLRAVGAVCVALVAPAGASAATTLGTPPPMAPTGEPIVCDQGYVCAASLTSGLRVPSSGVVTSWRTIASARTSMWLVRMRGTEVQSADDGGPLYAMGTLRPFEAGTVDVPVRLRVSEGDRLSLEWGGTLTGTVPADPSTGFSYRAISGGDGVASATSAPVFAATLEPDADGDALGDESQDLCPAGRGGPCPGITFVEDAAPSVMPGDDVTRIIRVELRGPGRTPPGTRVFVESSAQGVAATADGAPCAPVTGRGARVAACPLGAAGPGKTLQVAVRLPRISASKPGFRLAVEANDSVAYPATVTYWPAGPAAQTFTTPVPTQAELRPTVALGARVRGGRISATVRCPSAGTRACRVQVALRRAGYGEPSFARATVVIGQGRGRAVALRVPRGLGRRMKTRAVAVIATATRLDVPDGPAGSVTRRIRAR